MSDSLYQRLSDNSKSDYYPFHMPGHKRNKEAGPFADWYQLDITEIDGFDNLHRAEGILQSAQQKAADLYASGETHFLVNGSTAGILAAISAIAERGSVLLIARNCHKSVYNAAFLQKLSLEYIYPEQIREFGIADGIKGWQIKEKIDAIAKKYQCALSEVKGIIAGIVVTSPTYEGIISDIKEITAIGHAYEIPVIVDQAHGAHFGFHEAFPEQAVKEGADLVIHGIHKMLPAPTQTALLHYNGELVNRKRLQRYLAIYQTSSPSYLLMAGIESALTLAEKEGKERLATLLANREHLLNTVDALNHIKICKQSEPCHLVISVRGSNLSGTGLYNLLRETYHLQMEMSGWDYCVALLSLMDREEGFGRLEKALKEIDAALRGSSLTETGWQAVQPQAKRRLCEAWNEEAVSVALETAQGELAADFVGLYPPGIPLLVPGEQIDKTTLDLLVGYLEQNREIEGIFADEESGQYRINVLAPSNRI